MTDDEKKRKESALRSVTQGSGLYVIGYIVSNIAGFLINLLLSRGLGAVLYGVYAYSKTIINISSIFTNLGSNQALLKFLPQYEKDSKKQQFIMGLAVITSLSSSFIIIISLYILAPYISKATLDHPEFTNVLRVFSIILFTETLLKLIYSFFRSKEFLEYEVLTHRILKPVLRLSAVAISISIGYLIIGVVASLVVASIIALVITTYLFISRFKLRPSISSKSLNKTHIHEFYNLSLPMTLKNIGDIFVKRADILMVGFFLTSDAVGIYNIALILSTFIAMPKIATNQLFAPISSRMYQNQQYDELNSLYKTITRWVFSASLIMTIGLLLYRKEILLLFGKEYTAGTIVLILFTVSKLADSLGGANGYLLMMTERQYVLVSNQIIMGILNVVLNYLLILRYGLIGAAVATASVFAFINILKTIEIWYLEGLFPYSIKFIKPIVAGAISAPIMYLIKFHSDGLILIILGGFIGTVTYLLILYLLGVEEEDKKIIKEYYSQ